MNIKTIFELIIPFNHRYSNDSHLILSKHFQKINFSQTPQLEQTALLNKITTPLLGTYELSQASRRLVGLHGNVGHTSILVKEESKFQVGKLKLWFFKSGIGFITIHISANELNETQVLNMVSDICNIQQRTKISYTQSTGKNTIETRTHTIKDLIINLFDLIGDNYCSPINGITYQKAFCLFYGVGFSSNDEEIYNFLEMLRNQNKSNRVIAEYRKELFFRYFKYITWTVSERTLAAFCDLGVASNANEKFLTSPGGLSQSVFTNYLFLYLNLISSNLKINALDAKYNLFIPSVNNQLPTEARNEILHCLSFPVTKLSNEPHINRLFDEYLFNRGLGLKDKYALLCNVDIAVDISNELSELKKDIKDTKEAVARIEQQMVEWMNSVTKLVAQRKALFVEPCDSSQELLEEQRSLFVRSVAEDIAKIACENTVSVTAEENRLKNMFGEYWDTLDEFTRKALVSARVFLANSETVSKGGLDYSGVCISACSALEQELKLRFFIGYKEYLKVKFKSDYSRWPNSMRYICSNGSYTENTTFTIGSMPAIFGSKQRHEKTGKRFDNKKFRLSAEEKNLLNEYLETIMNNTETDIQVFFKTDDTGLSLLDRCEDVRCVYRNAAAHTEYLSVETANECCRDIIGISGSVAGKTVGQVQGLIYDLVKLTKYNPRRNLK